MKKMAMLLVIGAISLIAAGCDTDGCYSVQNCGSLYNQGFKCDEISGCYETRSECQSDPRCQ